ncbi:hypothetical protein ACFU3J_12485 [Streptomyces sp. NPDC057411]|uniref:DUF7144 family membrane protein n=1 Tax=unclassified Streptomyces TaxID=2593676 RepID=UPI0036261F07
MSQQTTQPSGAPRDGRDTGGWVAGGVMFAAVLLLCSGILAVLQGIAAVAEDDVYTRVGSYVFEFNLTSWGWIHIVLGALVALTGGGLLKGATWARFAGLLFASLSLLAQFLFLPYAPFWSILVMGIDVFVIWSLASSLDDPRSRTAAAR